MIFGPQIWPEPRSHYFLLVRNRWFYEMFLFICGVCFGFGWYASFNVIVIETKIQFATYTATVRHMFANLPSHTQILPSALRITTYCPVASSRNTERTASSPRPPHMMMSYLRITTSLIIKASHIGTTDTLPIARCRFPLHACRRRYHFFCTSWKQNNNSFLFKTIMPFSPSMSLIFFSLNEPQHVRIFSVEERVFS